MNRKSISGLSNFVIAEVLTDTTEGTTYGEVQTIAGAIDVGVTPSNTEPNVQYADNIEFDVVTPDPNTTCSVELVTLPLDIQSKINGHKIDDNGVMVKVAGDTPPYYAIGFRGTRRNGGDRYKWLLKCRANPVAETYRTNSGIRARA